jgi:bifunctional UDP-N-acetylglucosamine pyrophosphorylase / glucosamine-1-phosphate N-acetyltransferase
MVTADRTAAVVLAAGKGTRMKRDAPKVLAPLGGRPMLAYVLDALAGAGIARDDVIVVVGYRHEEVTGFLGGRYRWVRQTEQLGTGHAVIAARPELAGFRGTVTVLCGDVPLVTPAVIRDLRAAHAAARSAGTVLTAVMGDPTGYGRITRDAAGRVTGIVEQRDASEAERRIREINTGSYCFDPDALFGALGRIGNANAKGEYYLTDVVRVMIGDGRTVLTVPAPDPHRVLGVNTEEELRAAEAVLLNEAKA